MKSQAIFSRSIIFLLLSTWVLVACGEVHGTASIVQDYPDNTPTVEKTLEPPPIITPDSPPINEFCIIGTGMRDKTVPILLKYKDSPALVMSPSVELAANYFPQLEGWIRVIGAPSLQELQHKAAQAQQEGIPYEALGYGLESGKSTPEEEWSDLVGSTQQARIIADQYDKLLVMAPGFKLMSKNEDKYPPMADLADIWLLQTQRLQASPPGEVYRQDVQEIIDLIKSGNPDIEIWAQIVFPPNQEPEPDTWLAYRTSIADIVNGTYLGVYSWEYFEADILVSAMDTVYDTCKTR
jgi:hypothetical protein